MSSQPEHERASRIFLEAVDLPPAERDSFLDEACKGEHGLRREVESLLTHDSRDLSALEPAAFAPRLEPAPSLPTSVGPYRILETLGEGGMGVVYRAVQETPIRREVALKLIRAGIATESVIARFEAERQALALMSHPNIARVLDLGKTEHGQPYFAMEFVDGRRITAYCDEHRMTLRSRLELFIQVCEGVAHAHRKAIIHRDIKASNVLVTDVDGKPVPKIIDFGVAKAIGQQLTEKTLFTGTGMMVGTPEYMSPEQAEMRGHDIDTRTDVYSLGVLLYELITGSRPFKISRLGEIGIDEVRRIIREDEPPNPSRRLISSGDARKTLAWQRRTEPDDLARRLSGDLDWITKRALEKDPDRRYGSPDALAADIRRHLDGEPVLAGPPSVGYRVQKFVQRHRVGVGIAGALMLTLVIFAGAMTVQTLRIAQERDRANREAVAARQTSKFLANLFELPDPAIARGKTVTARELLDIAAEDIRTTPFTDRLVQAQMLGTLGEMYRKLGVYEKAEPRLKESMELRTLELGRDDPETLGSINDLAILYHDQGRFDEAEQLHLEALNTRKRVLGVDHPDTLLSMDSLAAVYMSQGRYDEAEPLLLDSLERRKRVLGTDHPETLIAMSNLAEVYRNQGRIAEAEPLCVATLEARRRVLGSDHPDTLLAMNNLANLYWSRKRYGRAESLHADTLIGRRRVLGADHPDTIQSMVNVAIMYQMQDRFDEAEPLKLEALETRKRVLGPEHPDTLRSMNSLAALWDRQDRFDEAGPLYTETLALQRKVLGDIHPDTLRSLGNLITLYGVTGRVEKARALVPELLAAERERAERTNADAQSKNSYAWSLLNTKPEDLRDPATALRFALEANEMTGYEVLDFLDTLAQAYHATGDTAKAVTTQRKAVGLLPEGNAGDRKELEAALVRYEAELRR